MPRKQSPISAQAIRFGNQHASKPYKVLIIEDTYQNIIQDTLTQAGHETEIATSAEAGYQKFKSFQPDLVLVDEMLIGPAYGSELVQKLIDEGVSPQKFICITSMGTPGIYRENQLPHWKGKHQLNSLYSAEKRKESLLQTIQTAGEKLDNQT